MTEYLGPGPIEGLFEDQGEEMPSSPREEEERQDLAETPEASIKDLLSETSLPGSDVLSPPPRPRKNRSLGIG